MYAVFKTGGKQYRASQGEKVQVEKLDAAAGDTVEFSDVLMVGEGASVRVGKPLIAGAKVLGKVVAQDRHDKITVIKFKRRTTYKRMHGHRQAFTLVEITGIAGGGA
jgi:large subunit ribosomal protein L21